MQIDCDHTLSIVGRCGRRPQAPIHACAFACARWNPERAAAAKGWRLLQLLLATQHATAATERLEVGGWLPDPPCVACPPPAPPLAPLAVLGCLALLRGGSIPTGQSIQGVESPIPLPEVAMTRQSSGKTMTFNIRPPGLPASGPPPGMAAAGLACGGEYRLLVQTHLSAALRHGLPKASLAPVRVLDQHPSFSHAVSPLDSPNGSPVLERPTAKL